MTFKSDFDLVCAYSKLSPEERKNAWEHSHYASTNAMPGAVRKYRIIARSLSWEERWSAANLPIIQNNPLRSL